MTVADYIELLKKMPQDATVIVNYHSDYHIADSDEAPWILLGRRHLGNGDLVVARPRKGEYVINAFVSPERKAEMEAEDDREIASWDADTEHKGPTETFVVIGH